MAAEAEDGGEDTEAEEAAGKVKDVMEAEATDILVVVEAADDIEDVETAEAVEEAGDEDTGEATDVVDKVEAAVNLATVVHHQEIIPLCRHSLSWGNDVVMRLQ